MYVCVLQDSAQASDSAQCGHHGPASPGANSPAAAPLCTGSRSLCSGARSGSRTNVWGHVRAPSSDPYSPCQPRAQYTVAACDVTAHYSCVVCMSHGHMGTQDSELRAISQRTVNNRLLARYTSQVRGSSKKPLASSPNRQQCTLTQACSNVFADSNAMHAIAKMKQMKTDHITAVLRAACVRMSPCPTLMCMTFPSFDMLPVHVNAVANTADNSDVLCNLMQHLPWTAQFDALFPAAHH